MKNGLSYRETFFGVLIVHIAMLCVVLLRGAGKYDSPLDILPLAIAVIALDFGYFFFLSFINQMTYTVDFLLLMILNMSVIFQSCFGKIGFAAKHYITCILALIFCHLGFLLCRNHTWLQTKKKWAYLVLGILILSILTLTGSRSMWIRIGSFSIQPSEFMKPVFVIMSATSILEQHKKKKILFFYVSPEMIYLTIAALVIFVLQWWCRDLGSLPTFAAVYVCALICRICYPRAKLDKKMIISIVAIAAIVCAVAFKVAPAYVQARLHADIWADSSGSGYQQCQALIALASGGLLGKGPGQGRLHNVFAYDTDIVFSSICEEWGYIMALLVVCMILLLVILSFINRPRSYFHTTLVMGTAAVFTVQMALNIFGSCNLIPFTGVTIPFISAGGSSMITSGFLAGMLKAGQSPVFRNDSILKPERQHLFAKGRKVKEAKADMNNLHFDESEADTSETLENNFTYVEERERDIKAKSRPIGATGVIPKVEEDSLNRNFGDYDNDIRAKRRPIGATGVMPSVRNYDRPSRNESTGKSNTVRVYRGSRRPLGSGNAPKHSHPIGSKIDGE